VLGLFLSFPILLASFLADETITGYGGAGAVWTLTELDSAPFPARATLVFEDGGSVSGQAPCNRFQAQQSVPYPWIEVGPIMATKMACPDLEAEGIYLDALQEMTLAEVSGPVLILSNDAGREMVFRAD
jgi:heat shock protein HslJ